MSADLAKLAEKFLQGVRDRVAALKPGSVHALQFQRELLVQNMIKTGEITNTLAAVMNAMRAAGAVKPDQRDLYDFAQIEVAKAMDNIVNHAVKRAHERAAKSLARASARDMEAGGPFPIAGDA